MAGRELPPSVDGLVAWSFTVRCARTFANYLNHVRIGCEIMKVSTEATQCSVVKRALAAIAKRSNFSSRPPMFLGRDLVVKLVKPWRRDFGSVSFRCGGNLTVQARHFRFERKFVFGYH